MYSIVRSEGAAVLAAVVALNLNGCALDAPPAAEPTTAPVSSDTQHQGRNEGGLRNPETARRIVRFLSENEEKLVELSCQRRKKEIDQVIQDALAGDAYAHWLAAALYEVESCMQDPRKSALWMERAALAGVVNSIEETGMNYLLGRGVLQDYVKAHAYLSVYVAVVSDKEYANVTRTFVRAAERVLDDEKTGEAIILASDIYETLPTDLIQHDALVRMQKERVGQYDH